jgi:hypothetical protein
MYSVPTADFVSSTLQAQLAAAATSATIGTGLDIPATNGILQVDYDSTIAVGTDNGPETISYATYASGTGALTGVTRGVAGTTDVLHDNGAKVSSGYSSAHLEADAESTWTANSSTFSYSSADGPTQVMTVGADVTTSIYPGARIKYTQEQDLTYYWKFEDSSAASVGSPTMANIGTPTYTAGEYNKALTLDGTDQALSITDAADLKPTGEFTIGAWVKSTATGATQWIFQSYSDNTNANGIRLYIDASDHIAFGVGNNAASDTTTLTGTTDIADTAYHYVVVSYRNNYTQIYIDGVLEVSGYTVTPTYHATNYVRIGVSCVTGASVAGTWFTGQIDDLFLINGYALDEQTIKAKYDAAVEQGTATLTLTKYALCTASSYSAPNTTITMYSGTDHALINDTISSVYYSVSKAPYGFPLKEHKWTVEYQSNTLDDVSGPTTTYKNYANAILSVPIGNWQVGYIASICCGKGASAVADNYTTLSTSATAETDPAMTSWAFFNGASASYVYAVPVHLRKSYAISTKTAFYLNAKTGQASTALSLRGDASATRIFAVSTLL